MHRASMFSLKRISPFETAYCILTGMARAQKVQVGGISRSQGQKHGFNNAIFKNILS